MFLVLLHKYHCIRPHNNLLFFFAYSLDTVNSLPSTYTDKFRSTTVMEKTIQRDSKKMDSNSNIYISWTIHGMWMIYKTFERGGSKFSNTTARALAYRTAVQQRQLRAKWLLCSTRFFCVREFIQTESATTVQPSFRLRFNIQPPTRKSICLLNHQFQQILLKFLIESIFLNHAVCIYVFYGVKAPSGSQPPHYRGFTITLIWTQHKIGSAPLAEWSSRRRDLYLTTHYTPRKQIPCPWRDSNPTPQEESGLKPKPWNAGTGQWNMHWRWFFSYNTP